MYVDFEYYQNDFHGRTITDSVVFESIEIKAAAYINKITYSRINKQNLTDEVKNAVCAVCEIWAEFEGHDGIRSENNDGYSVTYEDNDVRYAKMRAAAMLYLPYRLIYSGCAE